MSTDFESGNWYMLYALPLVYIEYAEGKSGYMEHIEIIFFIFLDSMVSVQWNQF